MPEPLDLETVIAREFKHLAEAKEWLDTQTPPW